MDKDLNSSLAKVNARYAEALHNMDLTPRLTYEEMEQFVEACREYWESLPPEQRVTRRKRV